MEEQQTKQGRDSSAHVIAILSFVAGLLSIFLWEFFIFQIAALVLGIIGITRTDENNGRWMAITGTVLGAVFLLVSLS